MKYVSIIEILITGVSSHSQETELSEDNVKGSMDIQINCNVTEEKFNNFTFLYLWIIMFYVKKISIFLNWYVVLFS